MVSSEPVTAPAELEQRSGRWLGRPETAPHGPAALPATQARRPVGPGAGAVEGAAETERQSGGKGAKAK